MIRIKKGLNIPINGLPNQKVCRSNKVKNIALLGRDYIGMKPSFEIKEGDFVKAGELLFTDKKQPDVRYTSPCSGLVSSINRGDKRVFESIIIEKNEDTGILFSELESDNIQNLKKKKIKDILVQSGLWTSFRTRPFSKIPTIASIPSSIFITAIDTRPLAANPEIVVSLYQKEFSVGMQIASKLHDCSLYLCTAANSKIDSEYATKKEFQGPHPAGLAGTHIHFIDSVNINKTVWHINYQDIIAIGYLFTKKEIWQDRVISLAGPQVKNPRLLTVPLGSSLNEICENEIYENENENENRVISGSILDGYYSEKRTAFLGRYHLQISVLEEGKEREFLHYLRAGFNRFSVMPIYISNFFKKNIFYDNFF